MRNETTALGASVIALSLLLGGAALAGAGNGATVDEAASGVPVSGPPGSVVGVRVRVLNTGTTTWSAAARHRLGATPSNQLVWSSFRCGGYVNSVQDSRVFLCANVAPGQAHDFQFSVTLPSSGTAVVSVRMVQDGVEWFGETQAFSITVATGCANAPLATPSDRWKLEMFGNKALSGTTVEQRYDAPGAGGFSFDWGTSRPSSCTAVDNFGIRFTRTINIASPGDYRFTTTTDDGVRLWVDGQLLIDRWVDQAPASYSARKFLTAGTHDVRMDYYENGGGAVAALRWEFLGGCANAPLATPSDRWKLEIFGNKTLSGGTVEQRYDAPGAGGFSFDWGAGRPSTCTDVDNFAVRFSRTTGIASSGDYTFTTTTDDGVRLWVDGQLLIDRWVDQAPASYSATKFLAAGTLDVRMDYYENGGGAVAALRWDASSGAGEIYGINVDPANPAGNPSPDDLKALGARWVRVEWKASKGSAFYDPKIRAYRDAGLKVLVIIDYATVAGKPNGTSATDADWAAYIVNFVSGVRSLAQHVGDGVDAWQVWNEPDLQPQPGYDPYVPAHQYAVMLRDTAAAIRSFSSRPVVTAGLLRRDAGYLTAVRQAAGSLPVDAVVVHPYGLRAPDDWPWSTWGFGNMSDFFERYLAFGKPLWVSEIGLSTQDSELQAQYLENVYRLVEGEYAGRVQVVFWFCWSDGMVSPFGVVDASGKPKPTYHRYQTVAPRY